MSEKIDAGKISVTASNFVSEPLKRVNPIMKHFSYQHLPDHLKVVSQRIAEVADFMDVTLEDGPEKSAGLRKLLEAKDCFVRAKLG